MIFKYCLKKMLFLFICVFVTSCCLSAGFFSTFLFHRPEFLGLINNIEPIGKSYGGLSQCLNGVLRIAEKTNSEEIKTAVELSYLMQDCSLVDTDNHLSFTKNLVFEILAKYYQLHYFYALDSNEQQKYIEYVKTFGQLEDQLLQQFIELSNQNAALETYALLIGGYFLRRYEDKHEDMRMFDAAISIAASALPLAIPLHLLMSQGGDHRILLDSSGVNYYFTAPRPYPGLISRSSTTSSYLTPQAYLAAEKVRQKLLLEVASGADLDGAFIRRMDDVLARISKIFQASYVIITPSGTSAEMYVTLLALLRARGFSNKTKKKGSLVTNIIVASGEVGSGSVRAAGCRHFDYLTSSGKKVITGECLEGISPDSINVIEFPARDVQTGIVPNIDGLEREIEDEINNAIEVKKHVVVLHMVHASKTGIGVPRFEFLLKMKRKYGKHLIVFVDAAQLRSSDTAVSRYLKQGFCVLITGSKFMSGPSFSGAALFPEGEAKPHAIEL